jgi:hypothetical protein
MAISASDEVRRLGRLGPVGISLITGLVEEELRRFPELASLAVEDVVQDFFKDRIDQVTRMLVMQATSDESFGRLSRRSVRNWLIDQVRQTTVGSVRRTVEKVLAKEAAFEQVPSGEQGAGRWRLAGAIVQPWGGSIDSLVAAAWRVLDVRVPKWSAEHRRPPLATANSLVNIVRAVLEEAGGSLETWQLTAVFLRRFAAVLDPREVSLASVAEPIRVGETTSGIEDDLIAREAESDATCAARSIYGRLTPVERMVLALHADAKAVEEALGLRRSRTFEIIKRTLEKVRHLAGTGDDAPRIVMEVHRLCP